MPYLATAYNIMIASPGDVARERVIAREVTLEWNAINSADRGIALMPVGWDTHSSPSMSGSAQAVINSQVLENCDLLIAIFWTRLGTPTGEYASGTVEEIERHLATGKSAMIYFSNAPVMPDSINQEQYAALVQFRESLRSRGLVSFFDDPSTFRTDLFRHISQTIIRDFAGEIDNSATPPSREELIVSAAARELLFAAVGDSNGQILYVRTFGGVEISTGGRNFIDDQNPRTVVRWEGALNELEQYQFIAARGSKRQIFSVTDHGYAYADSQGIAPTS